MKSRATTIQSRHIYTAFLSISAVFLIGWGIYRLITYDRPLILLLLLFLTILTRSLMTRIINQAGALAVDMTISLAAVALYDMAAGALVAAAAAITLWVITIREDKPVWQQALERLGTSVGIHILSVSVAGLIYQAIMTQLSMDTIWGQIILWLLIAAIASQVHVWLLSMGTYFEYQISPVQTWQDSLATAPVTILIIAMGSGILAFAIRRFDVVSIAALSLPILLTAYAHRLTVNTAKNQLQELENLITLRTQELTKTNEELQLLHEEKDNFMAVLTHDMRTPLTSVKGYAALLEVQEVTHKDQLIMANVIVRNSETLLSLVTNMLEIEQMNLGKELTLERSEFDLGSLVQITADSLKAQASNKNIDLQCQLPPEPIPIYADQKKIERVLLNLASNAVKYTPHKGIVKITAKTNSHHAVVEIEDSGYGIPPDELAHIFESYHRVKKHQHVALGTGLGLAIVKSLIDAHDGEIFVSSQVDVGSTFTISLPLNAPPHIPSPSYP